MNYQPFFGMHLLISDELLEASIVVGNATMALILTVVLCTWCGWWLSRAV